MIRLLGETRPLPSGAVFSHRTGARLYGIEIGDPGLIEITVPGKSPAWPRPGRHVRHSRLDKGDVREVQGQPVLGSGPRPTWRAICRASKPWQLSTWPRIAVLLFSPPCIAMCARASAGRESFRPARWSSSRSLLQSRGWNQCCGWSSSPATCLAHGLYNHPDNIISEVRAQLRRSRGPGIGVS